MTMLEIIEKKKFGQELTKEEIVFFANAAAERSVPASRKCMRRRRL